MTTITIPKEITRKGDLVIIPRKEYEEFLELRKAVIVFKPNSSDKKALNQARREMKKGNYLTLKQLKDELGIKDQ